MKYSIKSSESLLNSTLREHSWLTRKSLSGVGLNPTLDRLSESVKCHRTQTLTYPACRARLLTGTVACTKAAPILASLKNNPNSYKIVDLRSQRVNPLFYQYLHLIGLVKWAFNRVLLNIFKQILFVL